MYNPLGRKPDRNSKIVEKLNNDVFLTYEEVGYPLGLTRERVRQIYKRAVGKEGIKVRLEQRKKLKKGNDEFVEWINENTKKFDCHACGRSVTYKEAGYKHYLCPECSYILKEEQRNPYITNVCLTCGNEYHPFRNAPHSKYCSHECYLNSGNVGRKPKVRG